MAKILSYFLVCSSTEMWTSIHFCEKKKLCGFFFRVLFSYYIRQTRSPPTVSQHSPVTTFLSRIAAIFVMPNLKYLLILCRLLLTRKSSSLKYYYHSTRCGRHFYSHLSFHLFFTLFLSSFISPYESFCFKVLITSHLAFSAQLTHPTEMAPAPAIPQSNVCLGCFRMQF